MRTSITIPILQHSAKSLARGADPRRTGAIVDRDSGATLFSLEGSRRVGASWTLDVEARSFAGVGEADLLYGFRRDGYLSVAVSRHF